MYQQNVVNNNKTWLSVLNMSHSNKWNRFCLLHFESNQALNALFSTYLELTSATLMSADEKHALQVYRSVRRGGRV